MSPLPTMSLRVAPDRQALIRAIARVLKDSPGVAAELQGVLQRNTQHGVTQSTTGDAVLHDVLQRIAALEQRQAALERRDPEESHVGDVSPVDGRPEGATDGKLSAAVPEGPALPGESGETLWQGNGKRWRLTAYGCQVLAGMVTAGLPQAEMAARFGMRSGNMGRTVRRMFPGAQTVAGQTKGPEAGSS